ncbi:hypothetical protein NUBL21983_48070 [Klebsiella variicola]|nr:hypothetical protein NUBL21983_48070 [Klebsiella variicola]
MEVRKTFIPRSSSYWELQADFRLTDAGLAALTTVSLDLTDPASIAAVKMYRTRLSKSGFPEHSRFVKRNPKPGSDGEMIRQSYRRQALNCSKN